MESNSQAKIQKQVRYLTVYAVVSSLVFFSILLMSFNDKKDSRKEILKVRGLVVVDSTGVERVVIGAPLPDPVILGKRVPRGGSVSGILLFDGDGNERSGYVTDNAYGNVMLTLDDIGRQRAFFMAEPDGATSLWLWGKNGNKFSLTTTDDTASLDFGTNSLSLKK